MTNDSVIEVESKFYISTNSSYADNRIMVLNDSDTFAVFDRWGDIQQFGEPVKGIYHSGTRFLSENEFRINGMRPLLLSSSIKEENEVLSVDLTNEVYYPLNGNTDEKYHLPKGVIHIGRSKFLRNGACYEQIEFYNYGNSTYAFDATINFHGDFVDIFEVRGIKRQKRGEIFEVKHTPDSGLRICYRGLDGVERTTEVFLQKKPDSWDGSRRAVYHIVLEPMQKFSFEYSIGFGVGFIPEQLPGYDQSRREVEEHLHYARKRFTHLSTSNHQFNHWIARSQSDLITLLAKTPFGRYPYAGVPWYNTAFGRDGIITAYQTLWIEPIIAKDVLMFLATHQAREEDAYRDAEPGKILHEMRGGEMVELNEVPFKKYYGSVDSTPLFLMLAGAYYKRTADIQTIKSIWDNILAAINWIDKYGDIDGDGFVEYQYKSHNGLTNQGWKDSLDSISHSDGTLAKLPVALCEVQAYVYDAKLQVSMLAKELAVTAGSKEKHQLDELSRRLNAEAEELKEKFDHVFWDPQLHTYILALDGEKKPCRVKASNAGHCLFAGIAKPTRAVEVVDTLLSDEMFTGWGIRTLSSREKRFNPMSYHNGSVWPHDVAMIASGFARYGYRREALLLMNAMFDASIYIEFQRLPELFCGFPRRKGEGPTAYPVACSPQAWAVASVFMFLEASLSLELNAMTKKVTVRKPHLLRIMQKLVINGLKLNKAFVNLELNRQNNQTVMSIIKNTSDWNITFF